RARSEQIPTHADEIAEIEQLVELKSRFAHKVELHVNLQPLACLLQMGKSSFALSSNRHKAPGNADVDSLTLQLLPGRIGVLSENLWNGVRGLELTGIALLSKSFDLP